MDIKINERLNPIVEILGLIYTSYNYDRIIKSSIEELNKNGVNGELFLKKNLKIFDKYIKVFNKYKVLNEDNIFFLEEGEEDMFILIMSVILKNEEVIGNIDNVTTKELKSMILDSYKEISEADDLINSIDTLENIVNFVNELEIKENTKWQLMMIFDNPKRYYKTLINVIEGNRNAYNEAYKSIEKSLKKLMTELVKYVNSGEDDVLNNLFKNSKSDLVLTLAFGSSILSLDDTFYLGVLYEVMTKEYNKSMGNKGDLILKLKSLSDKSKLEIIVMLKAGSKYSLEIAESLKLTPATVSYHMATLLEANIVSVEKRQGKVYYRLNENVLKQFIEELSNVLL